MMYTKEELTALANFFVANNMAVISDEIYEHITYEFPHVSIASLNDDIKQTHNGHQRRIEIIFHDRMADRIHGIER